MQRIKLRYSSHYMLCTTSYCNVSVFVRCSSESTNDERVREEDKVGAGRHHCTVVCTRVVLIIVVASDSVLFWLVITAHHHHHHHHHHSHHLDHYKLPSYQLLVICAQPALLSVCVSVSITRSRSVCVYVGGLISPAYYSAITMYAQKLTSSQLSRHMEPKRILAENTETNEHKKWKSVSESIKAVECPVTSLSVCLSVPSLSVDVYLYLSVSVCVVLVHGDQVWPARLSSTPQAVHHHQPSRLHTQREGFQTQTQAAVHQHHQFVARCFLSATGSHICSALVLGCCCLK